MVQNTVFDTERRIRGKRRKRRVGSHRGSRSLIADQQAAPMGPVKPGRSHDCSLSPLPAFSPPQQEKHNCSTCTQPTPKRGAAAGTTLLF